MVCEKRLSLFYWFIYWRSIYFISILLYWLDFFMSIYIKIPVTKLVLGIIIIYISIFSIDLYQFQNKTSVYQRLIEKSIGDISEEKFFSFDIWITSLKKSSVNLGSGISMYILLILSVPVLVIGFFGGNPLVSARIILDSNQDFLAYIVTSLVCLALGVFLITFAVREPLKIIAVIRLNK